ncbi:MAG: sigma-54 dependent transcriptional regulator [Desulfuromonadia bacterium]
MSLTILVVEDDDLFRELLVTVLDDAGHTVSAARDGTEGLRRIQREPFDLVISDLRMPRMGGVELFREANLLPAPPLFIFITAFGRIDEAVSLIKQGALDFITKPLESPESLRLIVERARERVALRRIILSQEELLQSGLPPRELIFAGQAMQGIERLVSTVTPTATTVLLTGESGTGKEVIARLIHQGSRHPHPFIAINCAAIPETLLESELFGHERGAFTGASQARRGKFELAQGGTIFLDEIGEMPLSLQAKLLRVLQERTFERLGGSTIIKCDVRVIGATNRDLSAEVSARRFREDLFYRLNVFPITLPPLRERPEAIPLLARFFALRFSKELNRRPPVTISPDSLERLVRYTWPGNIRELQNVIERGVILASQQITPAELPHTIADIPGAGSSPLLLEKEEQLIRETLHRCGGNRRKTAAVLGISLRTLQYRLKRMGITGQGS